MIEPELYYVAFKKAYNSILETMPDKSEIWNESSDKKMVTQYLDWFNGKESRGKFSKTLVAYQMINILMQEKEKEVSQETIDKTCKRFLDLIKKIKIHFETP